MAKKKKFVDISGNPLHKNKYYWIEFDDGVITIGQFDDGRYDDGSLDDPSWIIAGNDRSFSHKEVKKVVSGPLEPPR